MKITIKKFWMLVSSVFAMMACADQNSYTVVGHLKGVDDGKVLIQQYIGQSKYISLDSAVIQDGKFILKGSLEHPKYIILGTASHRSKMGFWLENSNISISGHVDSLNNAIVEGSTSQQEYLDTREFVQPYLDEYRALSQQVSEKKRGGDTAAIRDLEMKMDEVYQQRIEATIDYIKRHQTSYPAASLIKSISYGMDWKQLDAVISVLDPKVATSEEILVLKDKVTALKKVAVGQKAPNFKIPDTNGQPIELYTLLGEKKLLLVDFWASWCGPCRRENPNLKAVYDDYHAKGFDIIGISLDKDKDKWVQAIEQDGLSWWHVSDLKGWDDTITKPYAVSAIPTNYLLNSDGVIIASNLKGYHLRDKVAEILNEQ